MSLPTDTKTGPSEAIDSVPDLLAHAHALESEAAERYGELAAQMETHHCPELAALFRKMAEIEAKHVAKVETLAEGREIAHRDAWDYRWTNAEGPETTHFSHARYGMTAHEALSHMLDNEHRAVAFFDSVAGAARDSAVRAMAADLAAEERQHVVLLQAWLERYPPPGDVERAQPGDPDEPVSQA